MESKAYNIKTCKSKSESIQTEKEIKEKMNSFKNAKAVIWYYDEILFNNIENGIWDKQMKNLDEVVRLRIFDKAKELHIWRSNGTLKGRLRTDVEGVEAEFVETQLILNGREKLITRNYIGYNDIGQAGYVDCRFVDFDKHI